MDDARNAVPVRLFKSRKHWAAWLETNHRASSGIWLKLAKKGSGVESVSYAEALEVALCYGWIDGQKKPDNEQTWLQKFVRRLPRSIWSKINREKALALIDSGKMKPAGLEAIEQARKNGRWEAAYDSSRTASVPDDLRKALDGNPRACAFFETLDSGNRYAVLFRIQTAKKAETRAKRVQQFVEMLARHEKFHP